MVALSPIDPTTVCVGDEATNCTVAAQACAVYLFIYFRERAGTRTGLACLLACVCCMHVILTGCDTMLIDQMPGRVMAVDCQLTTGQC